MNQAATTALGLTWVAAFGCGGGGPDVYPVHGKVAYKSKGDVAKLAGWRVNFESAGGPKVTGGGDVEADGSFAVQCHLDGRGRDGLPAGEYRVCLTPPRDGDERPHRPELHPRYQSFDKSGLKVTVGTGSNAPALEVEPLK